MKKIYFLIFFFFFFTTNIYAEQCNATTYKGTQCSRSSSDGEGYCWQHSSKEEYQESQMNSLAGFYKSRHSDMDSSVFIVFFYLFLFFIVVAFFKRLFSKGKVGKALGSPKPPYQKDMSASVYKSDPKIICRRCSSVMVERRNKKTQVPFLGCSAYPNCKYTESL